MEDAGDGHTSLNRLLNSIRDNKAVKSVFPKNLEESIILKGEDCKFCRISGTILFTTIACYSFVCAKKAKPKSLDKSFSLLLGGSASVLAMCRATNKCVFKGEPRSNS